LQAGDSNIQRKLVHIRRSKGRKDRFCPIAGLDLSSIARIVAQTSQPVPIFDALFAKRP
jgi:hypothetical protein